MINIEESKENSFTSDFSECDKSCTQQAEKAWSRESFLLPKLPMIPNGVPDSKPQ
jgi:hypothetical protein